MDKGGEEVQGGEGKISFLYQKRGSTGQSGFARVMMLNHNHLPCFKWFYNVVILGFGSLL